MLEFYQAISLRFRLHFIILFYLALSGFFRKHPVLRPLCVLEKQKKRSRYTIKKISLSTGNFESDYYSSQLQCNTFARKERVFCRKLDFNRLFTRNENYVVKKIIFKPFIASKFAFSIVKLSQKKLYSFTHKWMDFKLEE